MNNLLLDEAQNQQHESPPPLRVLLPDGKSHLKADGSGVDFQHEGIMITPTPGFVLKTKVMNKRISEGRKVFINVCYHDQIELPAPKKKLDENGNEIEGLNVPLSMSPIRYCEDKTNVPCVVVDAIMNPSVQREMENDTSGSYRNFVCTLLIQFFEQKFGNDHGGDSIVPLDRKYKLPRLRYFGYIDSKTGHVVRKESAQTQVLKQHVRNRKKQPKIEEITNTSTATPPVGSSTTSTLARKKNNVSKSSQVSEDDSKSSAKQKQELIKVTYEVSVKLTSGVVMSVNELVAAVNNERVSVSTSDTSNKNVIDTKNCGPSIPPPMIKRDHRFPLLLNYKINDTLTVSSVLVSLDFPSFDKKSTSMECSAYTLYLTSSNIQETKVVFPFCVDPVTIRAKYNENTCQLTIEAQVSSVLMEDNEPDVGSQPWILARALGSGSGSSSKKSGKESRGGNHDKKKDGQMSSSDSCINDSEIQDPYHTRPLYLNAADFIDTKTKSCMSSNRGNNTVNGVDEAPLPEDQFHAKDSLSQHWLLEQEKEQKERRQKSDDERKARKSDESVEFVNVDDFKPGGKYCTNNNAEKQQIRKNTSQDDDDSDNECNKVLRKAEALLTKKYEARLTQSMLWSHLF